MELPSKSDATPLRSRPPDAGRSLIARAADGLVLGVARHWLMLVNLAVALYVVLPFLAPLLMQQGYTRPARAIYGLYSVACHQLPDHSYFLFGAEPFYSLATLEANGLPEGLDLLQRRRFIGNDYTGYKVAICERDVAIYGSVLLAGLVFGLVRSRVRPLSWKVYVLFLIPIGLDGLTQLVGLRESNWWLRTITGALFGGASVWLAYPYLDQAMRDVIRVEASRQSHEKRTR